MLKGVANVWVTVEDLERALDFYQNTLEFAVIKRDGSWAEIDAEGLNIGLNARELGGAGRRWSGHNLPAGGGAQSGRRGAEWQRGRVPSGDVRARLGTCSDVSG